MPKDLDPNETKKPGAVSSTILGAGGRMRDALKGLSFSEGQKLVGPQDGAKQPDAAGNAGAQTAKKEPTAGPDKAPDAKDPAKATGGDLAGERMRVAASVGSAAAVVRRVGNAQADDLLAGTGGALDLAAAAVADIAGMRFLKDEDPQALVGTQLVVQAIETLGVELAKLRDNLVVASKYRRSALESGQEAWSTSGLAGARRGVKALRDAGRRFGEQHELSALVGSNIFGHVDRLADALRGFEE